jgi:hypothetical protein
MSADFDNGETSNNIAKVIVGEGQITSLTRSSVVPKFDLANALRLL